MLKFVATDEPVLLEYATLELQKIISAEDDDEKLRLYMTSLLCSRQCNGSEIKLSLVEAVFYLISIWSESKLEDYHLHFSQVNFYSLTVLLYYIPFAFRFYFYEETTCYILQHCLQDDHNLYHCYSNIQMK